MTEQLVPMTEEEQLHRNTLLRGKRRGIRLILLLLAPVVCAIIYLLQTTENPSNETMYIVTGAMTLILFIAILLYHRFARLINLDMQSHEKIVTTGIVVRANFYGNNVYATRAYGSNGQKYLTINVDGRWITLSGIQLKRLLPEAWQANRIPLGETFIVEMTPFGRHLMRLDRIGLAA